jgi:hypothetical protein
MCPHQRRVGASLALNGPQLFQGPPAAVSGKSRLSDVDVERVGPKEAVNFAMSLDHPQRRTVRLHLPDGDIAELPVIEQMHAAQK